MPYTLQNSGAALDRAIDQFKSDFLYTVEEGSGSSITLTDIKTTYLTTPQTALSVTIPTPTEGEDYLTGIIFKAGAGLVFTDTAPEGYAIVWGEEPSWAEGAIYEISYRCLWLEDSDGDTIISAKFAEVTA